MGTFMVALFLIIMISPFEVRGQQGSLNFITQDSVERLYRQYYVNFESRRESNGVLDSLYIFDEKQSGYNLVTVFGSNFFKLSNPELIDSLERYLDVHIDNEEMTFGYWNTRIPNIIEQLVKPKVFSPLKRVQDGFITYHDHEATSWSWTWPTNESQKYTFVNELRIEYDTLSKKRFSGNLDSIKTIINSFQNKKERCHTHFILLLKLHLSGAHEQLANESMQFIDDLVSQPALYDEVNKVNSGIDSISYGEEREFSDNGDTA